MERTSGMKHVLLSAVLMVAVASTAFAQGGNSPAANAARQTATDMSTGASTGTYPTHNQAIGNIQKSPGNIADHVPAYQGSDQPQTQYFLGGQGQTVGAGQARVGACSTQTDPNCEATNLVSGSRNTRPQFDISPNDPLITGATAISRNPTAVAGNLYSEYETCRTVTRVEPPILENQVCTEYSQLEDKTCKIGMDVVVDADHLYRCVERMLSQYNATCTVGRVIRVDPDYIYQCKQSPKKLERLTCTRALTVTCLASGDGCSPSGVVPGSTQGDMAVKFEHIGGGTWQLDFGLAQNNTWTGGTAVVEQRTLQFNIQNVADLTKFAFRYTRYDDWIWIRINGHNIYAGPLAGADRAILVDNCEGEFGCYKMVQYTADPRKLGAVNQRKEFHEFHADWDIRGGLVNGLNTIQLTVIRDYRGEGMARFHVRAACPANCTDQWDNGCAALEQRAR